MKKKKVRKTTQAKLKKLAKRERNRQDKEWKLLVRNRDENKCVICGRSDILHIHHLVAREIKELRHDIDNGITLCPNHHKFSLQISPHRNPFIFFNWMNEHRKEQLISLELKYNNLFKLKNTQ